MLDVQDLRRGAGVAEGAARRIGFAASGFHRSRRAVAQLAGDRTAGRQHHAARTVVRGGIAAQRQRRRQPAVGRDSVNVYVLSYGCIYEGGFIYFVDDTQGCSGSSCSGSIGGKTAAVTDTYPGQVNFVIGIPNWGGYGTDIGPSLYDSSIQGANDGSANTTAIVDTLGPPLSDYAAGLCSTLSVDAAGATSCTAPSQCYTNWYLPAVCELAPYVNCIGTNIQQQLFENSLIPSATLGLVDTGNYWSSTETTPLISPEDGAWSEYFATMSGGSSFLNESSKNTRLGVRCSRALTP